ncbi:MAG: 2-amino-4-hydroxy-6-hydroxymethyldihydropteridine diphosphokinase [Sphingobium sp.]
MTDTSALHHYLLALGSNRARSARLTPRALIAAAIAAIGCEGRVMAASPILSNPPMGPSHRRYANSALLLATDFSPSELLERIHAIERRFGRRRARRWGERRLDIDIILWSGGKVRSRTLTIPHVAFRSRSFVLGPASAIAPDWRDPETGLRLRHLHARLQRARPVDPTRRRH